MPQALHALTITTNLDKEEGEIGRISKDDVTQLGGYARGHATRGLHPT